LYIANLDSVPVARGITPLPKSVTATRIAENLKVVALDATDLEALNKIHQVKGVTRFVYPEFGVRHLFRPPHMMDLFADDSSRSILVSLISSKR
jgi:hypothetical protein